MKLFYALIFFIASTGKALANPACAICTVAVGASLGIAREMGVADDVVAVWWGALLILMFFWFVKWFDKKNWNFIGRNLVLFLVTFSVSALLYKSTLTYMPTNILFLYMDPFLFSTFAGAAMFHYSSEFYQWMKRKNGGRAHFPFEKVVVPVVALILLSVLFNYYPPAGWSSSF